VPFILSNKSIDPFHGATRVYMLLLGELRVCLNVWGRDTTVWWAAIAIGAGVLKKSDERAKTSGPGSAIGEGKYEGHC
jgi:hypothetical protein